MRKACLAAVALAISTLPVAAADTIWQWKGQCHRVDPSKKAPTNVTLTIRVFPAPQMGTLNGKPIRAIVFPATGEGPISFDTEGAYKGMPVVRPFAGTIKNDKSVSGFIKQEQGERVAECLLQFVSG